MTTAERIKVLEEERERLRAKRLAELRAVREYARQVLREKGAA